MVRWLVEKGVPMDPKSQCGFNAWHIAAGLDGGFFHAWPQTADLIMGLAKERGVTIDTTEPPSNTTCDHNRQPRSNNDPNAQPPAATTTPVR